MGQQENALRVDPGAGRPSTLEAREVEVFTLGGVELVTLSACATAAAPTVTTGQSVGEPVAGDDLASLSDAFLSAGAKSVVATLWAVDDATAATFMRNFYPPLARGLPKPAALAAARRALLAAPAFSNPRQWGAFIFRGDPTALTLTKAKAPRK